MSPISAEICHACFVIMCCLPIKRPKTQSLMQNSPCMARAIDIQLDDGVYEQSERLEAAGEAFAATLAAAATERRQALLMCLHPRWVFDALPLASANSRILLSFHLHNGALAPDVDMIRDKPLQLRRTSRAPSRGARSGKSPCCLVLRVQGVQHLLHVHMRQVRGGGLPGEAAAGAAAGLHHGCRRAAGADAADGVPQGAGRGAKGNAPLPAGPHVPADPDGQLSGAAGGRVGCCTWVCCPGGV